LIIVYCSHYSFSVIGPKTIRPYSTYSVAFSNSVNKNVHLNVILEDQNNPSEFSLKKLAVVNRRTVKKIDFDVRNITSSEYQLLVQSADRTFSFDQRVELLYEPKTMSVFIQTDKPVYTPGDLLRFRVIVVDADTRPVTSIKTVNIAIDDSAENSIRKWPYAKLLNGVFESQVQLASSPVLGTWSITVKASDDIIVTKQIEVKEYVLPKFFVKVYPSEVLLVQNEKVSLTLEAYYTFKEPVDGNYKVELFLDHTKRKPDFIKSDRITGKTSLEFQLKNEVDIDGDEQYTDVTVKVEVVETFSNRTVSITEKIPIYRQPYAVTLLPSAPSFRPGVPFDVKIFVKDQLGHPPPEENTASIDLTVEFHLPTDSDTKSLTVDLDEKGTGQFILLPHPNAQELKVTVSVHQSNSESKILVSFDDPNNIKVDKDIVLDISCTETMTHFSYIVVTKGNIVEASNVPVAKKKKHSLRLKMTSKMSPESRLLVYYTNREYLIFDDIELKFDSFNNDFKFDLNDDEYFPGQSVYIDVYASKDSYVAFSGIDESVLLVGKERHDFNKGDVLKELALYGATNDAEFDLFHKYGLFLKSTATVDTPVTRSQNARFGTLLGRTKQAIEIRTQFLESWLWKSFSMDGRNNFKAIEDSVPDTITTYHVSGFALSPTLGLGVIQQPVSFTVRKKFYLVANLPYSIKRGEVALIQVTVFNFLGSSVTTDVTLFNKRDEIEFVEKASTNNTHRTKAVIAPNNNGKPVSFMVKAKKLGQIAIKFQAENLLETDALEHMLRVTPESHRYEKNVARFIQLPTHSKVPFDVKLDIPKNIDEGSAQIKFTLDPDILGTTISNLDGLIRKPSGCGEQNMLHFVPNIVVLDYLNETNTAAEDVRTKAINFLSSGYQNQLRYKRSDGAFSVWGQSHAGSTFLTAFVAKSFKIAAKYIQVDKSIVDAAFDWLAKQQQSDGRFPEVGQVIHADMQGGLRNNGFALTAYVLIAFAENEEVYRKYRSQLIKTTSYIANNLDNMENPYDLSLSTYALMLANHGKRTEFLDKLVEISIFDSNQTERYWDSKPVDIEVAGYALLSYVAAGDLLHATPIMRWLNKQRYGLGGFPGTQDTFVGLKALATFAAKVSSGRNDYRVTIIHEPNRRRTFDVDRHNAFNIQELDIPNNIRKMRVEVVGIGNGYFQVAYQYYQNIQVAKPSFSLTIDQLNTTTEHMQQLDVCVKYIPKEAYQKSNMALVEIFLPSGLVADSDAITDKTGGIRRIERRFSDTSVVIYYDNLGPEDECFRVTAYRRYKIALHLPSYIIVYDYYNSERFAIQQYEGKVLQLCDICEDEDCETLSCENSSK
ncbi:AAEL001794-PA, partial [Aedes aegypti]